ncbi:MULTISPECIES: hypothetical protein [Actinomycetes]|nr:MULTISPECIES: hypothetical protein [unclassified Streptomyces]
MHLREVCAFADGAAAPRLPIHTLLPDSAAVAERAAARRQT